MNFDEALSAYNSAAYSTVLAHLQYKEAHGRALLSADAKNAEGRLAQADLASIGARHGWEKAKVAEATARAQVDYLIARANGGTPVAP